MLFVASIAVPGLFGGAARADGPPAPPTTADPGAAPAAEPVGRPVADTETSSAEPSQPATIKPIVIGFVGGFLRHDDAVHSTVILAHKLQRDYSSTISVQTFENRRVNEARKLVLQLLAQGHPSGPTPDQKRSARIVLYGHSWGASATVMLARVLRADGIPVRLTVQVDSVAKLGSDDAVIPENVSRAANFFQTNGFPRGQQQIRAADASHTEILGNFKFDYANKPVSCPDYPWLARVFMKTHIEIECDPKVWNRVDQLIREELPATTAPTMKAGTR
jgi:pimeloyl-ACP methyl ester carboxylesterase